MTWPVFKPKTAEKDVVNIWRLEKTFPLKSPKENRWKVLCHSFMCRMIFFWRNEPCYVVNILLSYTNFCIKKMKVQFSRIWREFCSITIHVISRMLFNIYKRSRNGALQNIFKERFVVFFLIQNGRPVQIWNILRQCWTVFIQSVH